MANEDCNSYQNFPKREDCKIKSLIHGYAVAQLTLTRNPDQAFNNTKEKQENLENQDDQKNKENRINKLHSAHFSTSSKESDMGQKWNTEKCGDTVPTSSVEKSKSFSSNNSSSVGIVDHQFYQDSFITASSSINYSSADTSACNNTNDRSIDESEKQEENLKLKIESGEVLLDRKQTYSPFPNLDQASLGAQNSFSMNLGPIDEKKSNCYYPARKPKLSPEISKLECESNELRSFYEKQALEYHETSGKIIQVGLNNTVHDSSGIDQYNGSDTHLIEERIPLERDVSQTLRRKSGFSVYSLETLATTPEHNQSEWNCQKNLGPRTGYSIATCAGIDRRIYVDPDTPISWSQPYITKVKVHRHAEDSFTFPIYSSTATLNENIFPKSDHDNLSLPKRRNDSATEWETVHGSYIERSDRISEKSCSSYLVGGTINCCGDSVADTSDAGYDFEVFETRIKYCPDGKNNEDIFRSKNTKLNEGKKTTLNTKLNPKESEVNDCIIHPRLVTPNCSVPFMENLQIPSRSSTLELAASKTNIKGKLQKILHKSPFKDFPHLKRVEVVQITDNQIQSTNKNGRYAIDYHEYENSVDQAQKNRDNLKNAGENSKNSQNLKNLKLTHKCSDNCIDKVQFFTLKSPSSIVKSSKFNESNQDLDLINNFAKNECIVAFYEDGPRVFGRAKAESFHDMEWIEPDSQIDFQADALTDPIIDRNGKEISPDLVNDHAESHSNYSRRTNCYSHSPVKIKNLKKLSTKNHFTRHKGNGRFILKRLKCGAKRPEQIYLRDHFNQKSSQGPLERELSLTNTHREFKIPLDKKSIKKRYQVSDNQYITMLRDFDVSQAPHNRQGEISDSHNSHCFYEQPRINTSTGHRYDKELQLDAERISILLFFICFALPPVLFPIYTFGGFDYLMSFFTYGKISRCNKKQKRWALWACFLSWFASLGLVSFGIWHLAKKS